MDRNQIEDCFTLHFAGSAPEDGLTPGTPGPAGVGIVLYGPGGDLIGEGSRGIRGTLTEASYQSLIDGLRLARDCDVDRIQILTGSNVVANQVRGDWKTKEPRLKPYPKRVQELLSGFEAWTIQHVTPERNALADGLARAAGGSTTDRRERS